MIFSLVLLACQCLKTLVLRLFTKIDQNFFNTFGMQIVLYRF